MNNKGRAGVQGFRMTMRRALAQALCALALLLAGSAGAYAQDGHNHGAEPRAISVAPRAETRIGNQEAVIAYDRNRLVLFLQRYSDGQPTTGAQLEMNIDFVPVSFDEVAPGTYVANDVMLAAGRNDLELTYKIGDRDGTVTVALMLPQRGIETSATRKMAAPSNATHGLLLAGLAIGIYIAVSALLAFRSRSRAA